MRISDDIKYIGVNDHEIDLFEGQYRVPKGMAYNSYVVTDEKTAVVDTVEARFGTEWLDNLESALGGRKPDYLIVQHMEPDHSANIAAFMKKYPDAVIVATAKAIVMMKQFFGTDFAGHTRAVKEGDVLQLGRHTFSFVTAPMVHWPEVMVTYDSCDQVLFSADAFGKFGALDESEEWTDEARRYYFGIVGKYGAQVQQLLKKAAKLDIRMVCPLHGPVLAENLEQYFQLYQTWSSYAAEKSGVVIAYTSVYGHTKEAAEKLAEALKLKGVEALKLYDLARCDMAEALAAAFCYDRLVLATTTYNAGIYPFMREFIQQLTEHGFQNRTVALIENGSWAPMAAKEMKTMLESCKNLTIAQTIVQIRSALQEESLAQLQALAEELTARQDEAQVTIEPEADNSTKKKFVCSICGYVYEGEELPEGFTCPICKHPAEDFAEQS